MGFDIYGTHIPVLATAVYLTRGMGPVLELGAGDSSTPLLHAMCRDRKLVTIETDAKWLGKFKAFEGPDHRLEAVEKWDDWIKAPGPERWAVALVDCAPGEDRVKLIRHLKDKAIFVVVHDTEKDWGSAADYKYEAVLPEFKHVSEYRYLRPYTVVASDFVPFHLDACEAVWTPTAEQKEYFDKMGIKG